MDDFPTSLAKARGRVGRAEQPATQSNGPADDVPPVESSDEFGLPPVDDRGGAVDSAPALATVEAGAYRWQEPSAIPRRQWLYGRHLIRGFVSATVAPGGTGKSRLKIVEALEIVSGKPLLLNTTPHAPLNVWIWNLEDPLEEITRGIQAACLHYGLTRDDIEGRLFVNSGRDDPCVIAEMRSGSPTILRPMVDGVLAQIEAKGIDVLMIDPFVSCHRLGENDNGAIDLVVKQWGMVADRGHCAVDLTHHTRKQAAGTEMTADSARGAKALVDGGRIVRVLNRMTQQEGERAGVDNHRLYFSATADKVNLSPPAERADWFRLLSVDLENGPPGASDLVGVAVKWEWPDALDGVSASDLLAVQKLVAEGEWRESTQSPKWVGIAVAEVLDLDVSSPIGKTRIKSALHKWLQSGALRPVERPDEKRRLRKFIEVGQWATQ